MRILSNVNFAVVYLALSALAVSASAADPVATTSRGNSLNPAISANSLILYRSSSSGAAAAADEPNGFDLQELELQLTSDVDPYWKLNATFSMHPELSAPDADGDRTAESVFEAEEAYAETIAVPAVNFRFGKFKTAIGKHNTLHTHAYPFIDAPLLQTELLGEEGFNDIGVSAAALLPTPWFSEVTAQAVSGEAEGLDYFNSRSNGDIVAIAHFKNLWDLTDSATVEFGVSGANGANRLDDHTDLLGADLTFKWRPVEGGKYTAFIWSTEALQRVQNEANGAKNERAGLSTWVQYQFARRWWAQARMEWLGAKDKGAVTTAMTLPERSNKWSTLLGFVSSEYSAVRVQYDNLTQAGADETEHRFFVQMNFSIGAHPAHAY